MGVRKRHAMHARMHILLLIVVAALVTGCGSVPRTDRVVTPETLATVLGGAGYATGAFIAAFPLDGRKLSCDLDDFGPAVLVDLDAGIAQQGFGQRRGKLHVQW